MSWYVYEPPFGLPRRYPRDLDPATCTDQGGHCWLRDSMVTASSPPIYTEFCKHCPAYRTGSPQESVNWSEPKFPESRP